MPETNFFSEEAARHILLRVSSVINEPELCDATFVVGDNTTDVEEIRAPSQFMAIASPFFKRMFYPESSDEQRKRQTIQNMQPQIFRKILDYLFRGKVPLSSIEDAWKVKVAGRQFELTELEDLCTKFLKYRLDSNNLLIYLKNAGKYNCSDLREVILQRFAKDAMPVLDDPEMLNLQETELLSLMEQKPEIQARKAVEILIKWAKTRHSVKTSIKSETDVDAIKSNEDITKTDVTTVKSDGMIAEKNDAKSTTEETQSEKSEVTSNGDVPMEVQEKSDQSPKVNEEKIEDIDVIETLHPFMKYISWDYSDADFFLNTVRGHKVMQLQEENKAMAEMIQSFCDTQTAVTKISLKQTTPTKRSSSGTPSGAKRGRK